MGDIWGDGGNYSSQASSATAVIACSDLYLYADANFTVADGPAAIDLLVSANIAPNYLSQNTTQSLTKSGAGLMLLTGSNTYTGGTTVAAGILQVGSATALGTGSLTINGGTLDINGNALGVGGLSGAAGTITEPGWQRQRRS